MPQKNIPTCNDNAKNAGEAGGTSIYGFSRGFFRFVNGFVDGVNVHSRSNETDEDTNCENGESIDPIEIFHNFSSLHK